MNDEQFLKESFNEGMSLIGIGLKRLREADFIDYDDGDFDTFEIMKLIKSKVRK